MSTHVVSTNCFMFFCRIIFEKIDTDKDGYLTHDELKKWVEHISHTYVLNLIGAEGLAHVRPLIFTSYSYLLETIHDTFPDTDRNGDNKISWDEYKDATFGTVDG